MAYFLVHSAACLSCALRSFFNNIAMSGTNGSSGLGSVRREQIDKRTLEIVKAGDLIQMQETMKQKME